MRSTREAAQGRWTDILNSLGIEERYLRNKSGPCPLCGGKDRYRYDNKEGKGTYYCNVCGPGDGMQLAIEYTGLPFREVAKQIDSLVGNAREDKPVQKNVVSINQRLHKISAELFQVQAGDPVDLYLKSRGLEVPHRYVKTHFNLEYWDKDEQGRSVLVGRFPAMVAPYRDASGSVRTFHVTYLTADGGKAPVRCPKKVLTGASTGGAIHLSPPDTLLGIAEGMESALAASIQFNMPVWAAMNTTYLEKFEPPAECQKLIIFADNDASFAGHKSAYALAYRLRAQKKIAVHVELPPKTGTDFADLLEVQHG